MHVTYLGYKIVLTKWIFDLLREPQATINLHFSLPLSHLFPFFLPSAPIHPLWSALLESRQKYTFWSLLTDIFQLAKQKSPL